MAAVGQSLQATVTKDFVAQAATDINLSVGEHISDIQQLFPHIWFGRHPSGVQGLFPASHVRLVSTYVELDDVSSRPALRSSLSLTEPLQGSEVFLSSLDTSGEDDALSKPQEDLSTSRTDKEPPSAYLPPITSFEQLQVSEEEQNPTNDSSRVSRDGTDRTIRRRPVPSTASTDDSFDPTYTEPSRSTEVSTDADKDLGRTSKQCFMCKEKRAQTFYCNVCRRLFCEACWDTFPLHSDKTSWDEISPNGLPHEKTDSDVAEKVMQALTPPKGDVEKEKLHRDDEDTTWFGVVREAGDLPSFQDYGRYANLIASTRRAYRSNLEQSAPGLLPERGASIRDRRYPSIVSFVGQTGAGKSTLIKLLIDLVSSKLAPNVHVSTPIVGEASNFVPTSDDVHLYLDPKTSRTSSPFFYADCEGLEGGEREPTGAAVRRKAKSSRVTHPEGFRQIMRKQRYSSKRELQWADESATKSREFAVTHLYPRLLYCFSDVIVFVLKNPRTIESVFERLISWAAVAIEKSSNQPILPHAIIALNASPNDLPESLWDVTTSTDEHLTSLSRTVYHNTTFKKYAQFWRERQRDIESLKQLILSYYSSIQIVYIPKGERPQLLEAQITELYRLVIDDCSLARTVKSNLRMLLDVEELQPYLQFAFDHFAETLDTPFDFIEASFANSPIPLDFGGNVLKLAIDMLEAQPLWEAKVLLAVLARMVASCIMLDSARGRKRGTASKVFPQYIEHLDAFLLNLLDHHWRCEETHRGERCTNVRSGHSKGHQLENGMIFAAGDYWSRESFDTLRYPFLDLTYGHLEQLLAELNKLISDGEDEEKAAADMHKDVLLAWVFHEQEAGSADNYYNNSVCLVCLSRIPEHPLPCGHILCSPCISAYGTQVEETLVEIFGCPLEAAAAPRYQAWKILLKPQLAGSRILTLDGGGIRGIVELEVLSQIEAVWQRRLRVQSFFDLIVGTSTGGLISLGLGNEDWSVDQCVMKFETLCQQAFTRRSGGDLPLVGWLVDNNNHSKYRTTPLQKALIGAFGAENTLFAGRKPSPELSIRTNIKVAVTSTSAAGNSVVLANYNRSCEDILPYQFQRPDRPSAEIKVWEAARATSAAPRIFKPFHHEQTKQVYMDGGIYYNNPIHVADRERKLIWPEAADQHPDLVLSIGTSFRSRPEREADIAVSKTRKGIFNHIAVLLKVATDHIAATLDCEKTWADFMGTISVQQTHRSRYVRINPELSRDPPVLDDVSQMKLLQRTARDLLNNDSRIEMVALRLICTSFFFKRFDLAFGDFDTRFTVKGTIMCRFPDGSPELMHLGAFLRDRSQRTSSLQFLVYESGQPKGLWRRISIDGDIITNMIRKKTFLIPTFDMVLSSDLAFVEISLDMDKGHVYPISGFPRKLLQEPITLYHSHPIANTSSARWTAGVEGTGTRRKWIPPQDRPSRHISAPAWGHSRAPIKRELSRVRATYPSELSYPLVREAFEAIATGGVKPSSNPITSRSTLAIGEIFTNFRPTHGKQLVLLAELLPNARNPRMDSVALHSALVFSILDSPSNGARKSSTGTSPKSSLPPVELDSMPASSPVTFIPIYENKVIPDRELMLSFLAIEIGVETWMLASAMAIAFPAA